MRRGRISRRFGVRRLAAAFEFATFNLEYKVEEEFSLKSEGEEGFIARKACDGKPYLHCAARRAIRRREE